MVLCEHVLNILVLRISRSIMLLEIFFTVVLRVLDTLYLYLAVNEIIVNENQICRTSIFKDFL